MSPYYLLTPRQASVGRESGEPQGDGCVSVGGVGVPLPPCLSVNVRKYFPFIPFQYMVVPQKADSAAYFYILNFIIFYCCIIIVGFKSDALHLWLVILFIGHVLCDGTADICCVRMYVYPVRDFTKGRKWMHPQDAMLSEAISPHNIHC